MVLTKWMVGCLLCCAPLFTNAQKPITLSWLPTSFIEVDAGLTVGTEYRVNKRWALLSDVGFIFYTPANDGTEEGQQGVLGYKLKPEARMYFRSKSKRPYNGGFIGLEGLYKHVNYHRFDGLPVFDNMGNLAYTYYGGYRIIKDVYGLAVKFGYRHFFGPQHKIGLEFYGGLGGRVKTFAVRDIPPGGSFDRSFFRARLFDTHWLEGSNANIPAGIKLLWRIR